MNSIRFWKVNLIIDEFDIFSKFDASPVIFIHHSVCTPGNTEKAVQPLFSAFHTDHKSIGLVSTRLDQKSQVRPFWDRVKMPLIPKRDAV